MLIVIVLAPVVMYTVMKFSPADTSPQRPDIGSLCVFFAPDIMIADQVGS